MNEIIQVNEHLSVMVLDRKPTYQSFVNIVLCAIVNKPEYVTWIENTAFSSGKGFVSGHYFDNILDAYTDFRDRS